MSRVIEATGLSVRVTVPQSTAIAQGDLVFIGGFFGIAVKAVTNGVGVTAPLILDISQCEIETSQIYASDAFDTVGAPLYWDAANKRLTTTALTHKFVGKLTLAKSGGVIQFLMAPQAA